MDFSDKLRMGGEDRTQIKTSECGSINSIIALNKSKQVDPGAHWMARLAKPMSSR